jgi:hypothetical protein
VANILLDFQQRVSIVFAGETDRVAAAAGTRGATDTMHVIFRILR